METVWVRYLNGKVCDIFKNREAAIDAVESALVGYVFKRDEGEMWVRWYKLDDNRQWIPAHQQLKAFVLV